MSAHFSPRLFAVAANKDDRPTPQDLFDEWNKEFGFTVDAAASPENAKCARYFTVDDDGLAKDWGKEIVWCNPPYTEIRGWVEKAVDASRKGATVVMLLPNSTDTAWFHDAVLPVAEIRFIRGRIKFVGMAHSAPFGSMLCIFKPEQSQ